MNELKLLINQADTQMAIVTALKRYHQLSYVVNYINLNYQIGYNDDQQLHPEHQAVPLEELKAVILAALAADSSAQDNA